MGVSSAWLSGESAEGERDSVLARFGNGDIRALLNCSLFTTGTDIPSVTCIVNAAPTLSRNTYVQKVGRGLRLCPPHKEDLLILDLVGAHEVHGLITAENMTEDTVPKKKKGKGVPPLNVNLGSKRDVEFGMVLATAEATQSGIAVKAKKKNHRTKWLCVLEERVFALSAGEHGALIMIREPGDLDMWMGYRLPDDAWAHDEARKIMHRPAPRELTAGVVEDRARKLGVFGLSNENARWRDREPSEAQMTRITRMGLPVPESRGECADLITTHKLRTIFRSFK
jgi:superfamily II DNA/RNA helicase